MVFFVLRGRKTQKALDTAIVSRAFCIMHFQNVRSNKYASFGITEAHQTSFSGRPQ